METIHVRSVHLDDPSNAERLYQSSEFIHRLSGSIMTITHEPPEGKSEDYITALLIEGVTPRGAPYLRMLADWIKAAEMLR